MIRLLLITTSTLLIVVLLISFWGESGYVYIKLWGFNIEMSFIFLFILFVICTVIIHYLWTSINKILNFKKRLKNWQYNKNLKTSYKLLSDGFIELGNGNYKKAEKILLSAASKTDYSLVPFIGAANAAQQRGDTESRNLILEKALKGNSKATIALNLTKADYLLTLGNYLESQKILNKLENKIKKNSMALKIQANIYSRTNQWDKLLPLIPKLKNKTNLSDEEISQLEYHSYRDSLIKNNDFKTLQESWKKTPKALQENKGILIEYIHKLNLLEKYQQEAEQITKFVDKNFDQDLVLMYSELPLKDSANQINKLQNWLATYPKNHTLYLALAKVYIRKKLWVMAQEQIKKSIEIKNSSAAKDLLLQINEKIDNFNNS